MFAAAIVVFRESLEAALIISIMAAATRGISQRARWIVAGVVAGIAGAALVASSMGAISDWASGMGQEWFNIAILSLAVVMLACVGISSDTALRVRVRMPSKRSHFHTPAATTPKLVIVAVPVIAM